MLAGCSPDDVAEEEFLSADSLDVFVEDDGEVVLQAAQAFASEFSRCSQQHGRLGFKWRSDATRYVAHRAPQATRAASARVKLEKLPDVVESHEGRSAP